MIKARHHWLYVRFFRFYSRVMIRWHFRNVVIKGDVPGCNKSILLIGNHFSWWDGFFANYLNNSLFHRRFHVMMLEEQLRKRMFLNKAGVYSIKKQSRSVAESIAYTRELLSDPANLVTLYPQGEIRSMFQLPVRFEKGIGKMVNGLEDRVQIIFFCALIDYFSHRKPSLTFGLKEYIPEGRLDVKDMEEAFNQHLQYMISQQTDIA